MTLNTGAFPSVERESFLLQVLEPTVDQKYYLSQKACLGILRRAKTRGKVLPEILHKALVRQAGLSSQELQAVMAPWDVQSNRIVGENGKAATLYGGAGQGTHNGAVMQSIGLDLYNGNTTGDIAATITASSGKSASQSGPSVMQKCYGISSYESNAMKSQNPSSGIYEADKARTLDTSGGNPACNQGGIAVTEAKTIGIATQSYYDMQISDKGATLRATGGAYGGAVRHMSCKLASGKEDNKKCNIL